jgi:hypothetical protein
MTRSKAATVGRTQRSSSRAPTCLRFEQLEERQLLTLVVSGNGNTDSASLVSAGGPGTGNTIGYVNVGESSTHNASVTYLGNRWCLTANHVTIDNNVGLVRFGGNSYTVDMSTVTQLLNTDSTPTDLKVFRLTTDPGLPVGMTPGLPWILPSQIATSTPSGRQIMIGNGLSTITQKYWNVDKTQNPWVWSEQSPPFIPGLDDYSGFTINTSGRAIRWGENNFDSTFTLTGGGIKIIGYLTEFDDLLYTGESGLASEAQASNGDSGGAVFSMQSSQWKLSGMMLLVNDPLSGQPSNTALFGDVTFMADLSKYRSQILAETSGVATRALFYKGSTKWDVTNGSTFSDDNAIAPDKTAYLPGSGTSAFSSVSSYTKGINGVIVDLYSQHGTITASDFIFKVGNNNSPNTWTSATAPTSVIVRAGAGVGGTDRVELLWADNAIQNTWLQVVVKGNDALGGSNTNTGITDSDVFYFGSAIGDSGAGNAGAFQVTSADEISARSDPHGVGNPATISNVNDFNRNGLVDSGDQIVARNNVTNLGNQLKFLVVGAGGPFAPQAAPGGSADGSPAQGGDAGIASALATSSVAPAIPLASGAPLLFAGESSGALTHYFHSVGEQSATATSGDGETDDAAASDEWLDALIDL